jgi:hypothetical protein
MKHDNIDVQTLEDVSKLVEHIKNNVVTLMLVYADWCGHCGTFKKDIWEKLANLKGRKVAMAQVNEKILSQTPFSGLKINGYPTNVLVGKDMKAATMNDPETGESTNALPNNRDMASMTKLVTANPSQVMANVSVEQEPKSATPTLESAKARREGGEEALNNLNNGESNISADASVSVPNPPDIEDDIVSSQTPAESAKSPRSSSAAVGGSLYASLLEATRELAVPAILTGTAIALTRKTNGRRKGTKKLRGRGRK